MNTCDEERDTGEDDMRSERDTPPPFSAEVSCEEWCEEEGEREQAEPEDERLVEEGIVCE